MRRGGVTSRPREPDSRYGPPMPEHEAHAAENGTVAAPREPPDLGLYRVLCDDGSTDPATDPHLSDELARSAYREMKRLRLLDARMILLQRQGRVGFYGACTGQEATPIAAALAIEPTDWVFQALRESVMMLVRGFPLTQYIAQVFGNSGDILKGRQMPSHMSGRSVNQVSWSSCLGPQLPQAVGAAWAAKLKGERTVVLGFVGDGATSEPDFHAAMNFASVFKTPSVLICQNNHWAISVPASRQTASPTLAIKARAYGMPGLRCDGNDLLAVAGAVRVALDRARAGEGPTFLEAVTYRMGAHSTSDDPSRYRSQAEVDEWAQKDPLDRLRRHMVHLGLVSDESDAALDRELGDELTAAIDDVEREPPPPAESLFEDVYAEVPWPLRQQQEELKKSRIVLTDEQ
jgi:pyruvate dehydrogenase E1 component alpha subunit